MPITVNTHLYFLSDIPRNNMKIYKTSALQDCLMSFSFRNKYDMRANEVSRRIFDIVKNNRTGEFSDDNIRIDIARSENNEITNSTFENFHIIASAENDKINITILLG